MTTAAFRSTTKRSSIGDADGGGGGSYRRSRSLSRYSGRFPPQPPEPEEFATPRARFVNKSRGSGFPEVSLDDLADEFFRSRYEDEEVGGSAGSDGRKSASRRVSDVSPLMESAERRRGRSVSRSMACEGLGNGVGREVRLESGRLTRQRSVSVVRQHRCSNLENDRDLSNSSALNSKSRKPVQHPTPRKHSTPTQAFRRSMSQKDLLQSHDSYSSNSSSVTDDEAQSSSLGSKERTIRAVYDQKKAEHPTGDGEENLLYQVMRKEVRHAVEEIRTELEKVIVKAHPAGTINGNDYKLKGENVINAITEVRQNYTNKLEESEKRRQDLLAELAVEEERGQELTKIVRELLPTPKHNAVPQRISRPRKKSSDKNKISKHLTEEAERYFEDFLSNVEDTDISSYDGERSDTSSTRGGSTKLKESVALNILSEVHANLAKSVTLPADADGVVLPWLQWETNYESSPLSCKSEAGKKIRESSAACNKSNLNSSSPMNWTPEGSGSCSHIPSNSCSSLFEEPPSCSSSSNAERERRSSFNMEYYADLQRDENLLFEMYMQRQRLDSGNLLLCGRTWI